MPGIPDVLACDPRGGLHLIELKATHGLRVAITPHQVAFLTTYGRRGASVWLLVRQSRSAHPPRWLLFPGWRATDVAIRGLREEYAAATFDDREAPAALLDCIAFAPRDSLRPPSDPDGEQGGRDEVDIDEIEQQLLQAETRTPTPKKPPRSRWKD